MAQWAATPPEVLASAQAALRGHEALRGCWPARWSPSRRAAARRRAHRRGHDAELDETRRLRDEGRG
jgi:hypothetical protein